MKKIAGKSMLFPAIRFLRGKTALFFSKLYWQRLLLLIYYYNNYKNSAFPGPLETWG